MIFPTIMLWVWMAAQHPKGNPSWDDPNSFYHWQVAPAEHVIEIRTKRHVRNVKLEDCASDYDGFYCGNPPKLAMNLCRLSERKIGEKRTDSAVFTICESVTREIWIDGQRWGVLKESK